MYHPTIHSDSEEELNIIRSSSDESDTEVSL